jgi:hypothetical protein
MQITPDINIRLLVLEAPDGEVGGGARFVAFRREQPHIGD